VRLSASSRASKAARTSSLTPLPRIVWFASACTVARVFLTRWLSSFISPIWRDSASLRSEMSTSMFTAPTIVPEAS
jgi:hypothetical protein